MFGPFRRRRTGYCSQCGELVNLDRHGLVLRHYPWFIGGLRACIGTGRQARIGGMR